jgi:Lantibiotic dehydratase, N terminus
MSGPEPMTQPGSAHLVQLGQTGWATWRDVVLRSAGFPADAVRALSDSELAAAADAATRDPGLLAAYRREHAAAGDRLAAAMQKVAQSPEFREAVTWQNPQLVARCLDKVGEGRARTARTRGNELTVASYLQRYAMKNDTIGFFGPVCWARWTDDGPAVVVELGERFLRRRTTYFEVWAIDAVARTLSADPELRPWLAPRLVAAHRLDGATLHVPSREPVALAPDESAALSYVDGARSVQDIAAELARSEFPELGDPAALLRLLESLVERGMAHLDLVGTIEAWPERTLLAKLERIAQPEVRERALATVRPLLAARDRVAAAAGDDVALEAALAELAGCFTAITGVVGERHAGKMYAGRTLVYEDTVRDARVILGPGLREQLTQPLRLLLDSARWLVAEIGEQYDQLLHHLYDRRVAQTGAAAVPLATLLSLATPQLYFQRRRLSKPVHRAIEEFQRRWAAILALPADGADVRLRGEDIAAAVAEQFPHRPAPWATAIHHSPDVMVAAADAGAIERGDCLLVLGELHLSFNTMESGLFVQQHDDPSSLLAAAAADLGDRRVCFLPSREIPTINSRVAPPSSLLSPRYTYWTMHRESAAPPAPILPAADLVVHREGGQLVVRTTAGDYLAPLLHVIGDQLSAATLNAFKPMGHRAHSPRVAIDRLVIARESWTFPAVDLSWAKESSEADRFLAARAWRARHDLPETAFYEVPFEDKPSYVDFTSLVYVNALAKAIRRAAEGRESGSLTLSEALPDQSQLWLTDADGGRYACELRLVAVDLLGRGDVERPDARR